MFTMTTAFKNFLQFFTAWLYLAKSVYSNLFIEMDASKAMQKLYCESPFPKELTNETYVIHWPAKACHLEFRPCPTINHVELVCTFSLQYRAGQICCIPEQLVYPKKENKEKTDEKEEKSNAITTPAKTVNEQEIDNETKELNNESLKFLNYIIPGFIGIEKKKIVDKLSPVTDYSELSKVYLPMPNLLYTIPQEYTGPVVTPILLGEFQMNDGKYKMPSTAVWVRDGPSGECDLIVDTGIPMHKNTLVGGLAAHGMRPDQIEYVVLTHSAPDSIGNLNLFVNSDIFSGNMRMHRDTFYEREPNFRPALITAPDIPNRPICNNTALFLTQGHTLTDITVVVRNVKKFGTISITGNLFFTEHDIDDPTIWRKFSWDPAMQEVNRRIILCLSDYIIPGHGKTFKVTERMKEKFDC